jgi:hypothetical protein
MMATMYELDEINHIDDNRDTPDPEYRRDLGLDSFYGDEYEDEDYDDEEDEAYYSLRRRSISRLFSTI